MTKQPKIKYLNFFKMNECNLVDISDMKQYLKTVYPNLISSDYYLPESLITTINDSDYKFLFVGSEEHTYLLKYGRKEIRV